MSPSRPNVGDPRHGRPRRVPAVIAALLLACRPEPEPPPVDSVPEDPFAACPPLAWVVQLDGNQTEEVHTVELLPDGDVVVVFTDGKGEVAIRSNLDFVGSGYAMRLVLREFLNNTLSEEAQAQVLYYKRE